MKSLSPSTPWTVAHPAPPPMDFSRQEYWSGLPFPSPGDLPNPGIEPRSPALRADALTSEPPGKQRKLRAEELMLLNCHVREHSSESLGLQENSSPISSLRPFLSLLLSFLRVHWTARRSNQSILKEISLDCSLEGLMLKLKLQYFGHLIRRTDSFEKTLMLGKIEGKGKKE